MTKAQTALLAAACALGVAAFRTGPVVRRYAFGTGRLRPGSRLRFAVLSDLHSKEHGRGQGKLLSLLAGEKPDCILLPGDVVDERLDPAPAWELLRGAARIAPSFYSPGNHEYRTKRIGALLRAVERCGVNVLADRAARLDTSAGKLLLAGREDWERARHGDPGYRMGKAARRAFAHVPYEEGLRVVLVHRPELAALSLPFGFDLIVSGHAHGGQARIPFLLNGLYAPGQGVFPRLAGGLYDLDNAKLLVSRGLGGFPPLPRVFNPYEIPILEVSGMRPDP